MKTIKGSTNPKAEEKTFYELSDFIYQFENPLFGKKENEKHIWTLYKQVNNKWKQVSGKIKYGEKVPYTFGEKAVGISFKIEVHTESKNILNKIEKKLTASLVVVPRTKHEPVIGRVILLNRNNADVNKATFNESLSAEARTSNLVGKEITFYLWEEGATEEKKYQKPKTAKVDIYGIAKIKFKLSEYATPQTWMNFFSGNDNTTKKFFVSASYLSKETTNKTPVSVTEAQQQQPPKQQAEKKEESTGFIEKATNIIAEGIGKIGDYVEEKTRTATSVGSGDVQKRNGNCPNCETDITLEQIIKIFPRAKNNETLANNLVIELNKLRIKYEINTCQRKAHLITQMGSETEFRTLIEEIGNYSVSTLKTLFGYFKRHPNEAQMYQGNTYELAVRAYGLRSVDKESDIISCSVSNIKKCNDLGNENKQDGYKYIGRGLIQLTGKYNYTQINKEFAKAFPNQGNLVQNPELLEQPTFAAMSGLSYWINNNLNRLADQGVSDDNVDAITKVINKNLDSTHYTRRKNFFKKAKQAFKLNECKNIKPSLNNLQVNDEIIIRLVRKWQNSRTTIGTFTIDNTELTGYILEEKGPSSVMANQELRVPTGEYKMAYHAGSKIKKGIHVWNEEVPFSRYILIHTGNTSENTEGCLIVGTNKVDENTVSGSREKFK